MKDERFKKAEFAAWLGIVGNLVLALIKVIIGFISNSKALIADAAHSFSDVVGSLAVLFGVKAAQLPPDEDHPYGHGKAENISAIVVAVILFFVGIEIAISSIKGLFGSVEAPGMLAIYGALISIVLKEAMFQYKYRLGKRINSQAIIANAWEHRSDVFSSLAALIGIAGSILGGHFGISWLIYFDPLAGALVALFIIKMAYQIGKDGIHITMDHVLHGSEAKDLIAEVEKVQGVLNIDDFYAREHGHYLIVDIKLGVNPKITVEQGHQIGKEVKERLMRKFPNVHNVFIHINPYSAKYPYNDDNHTNGIIQ